MSKDTTVFNELEQRLATKPDHIVLDVAGDKVTSSTLLANIATSAKALDMLGVKPDQPITVIDDTTEPFINLFYGSNRYGSIFATPGFPTFSDSPGAFTEDIGSDTLIISRRFYEALESNPETRGVLVQRTGIKNIVLLPSEISSYQNLTYNASIDELIGSGFKLYDGVEYIDYTSFMQDAEKDSRVIHTNKVGGIKDIAYLFTSGSSTGKPKTLRIPNTAFLSMCEKLEAQGYDFNPDEDKYLATLPCNFVTPLETLNMFLQLGVPAYIDPLVDFSKIADIYYRSGATIIMCPPSLLDPLYIMVTKSRKAKISFILETIKNAPKNQQPTKTERKAKLQLIKKMFEKRPSVKYVFAAGEPLTERLKGAYQNDGIEILNCTGAGETGPTAINGIPLAGDSYRLLDPSTLEVIYSSAHPDSSIIVRGLEECEKSASAFNGYLGNDELTATCYNVSDDGIPHWKYYDVAEVAGGVKETLCRMTDAIFLGDKIITPRDLTKVILEDKRILKCEAYPVTIGNEDRMVVDIVIRNKYRKLFNEIIRNAHRNILSRLGEEYLPFGYKDNAMFGSNPYTAKLNRDAIRQDKTGYICPVTGEEIVTPQSYESVNQLMLRYKAK